MNWDPFFYKRFQGFESVQFWEKLAHLYPQWPTIEDYNRLKNKVGFIAQNPDIQYESQIYHHKQVPTRLHNWHDFFNNVTWLIWPKLKWALIEANIKEVKNNHLRTPMQNLLAHFDECGMVICSTEEDVFEDIKAHRWKKLFLDKNLLTHTHPFIVGHGLLEKGLNPYIGMTGKAIFMPVEKDFFTLSLKEKITFIDAQPLCLQKLWPFPLLGWPGWYPHQEEVFYDNAQYFREKKIPEQCSG